MTLSRPAVLVVDDIDANLAAIEAQLGAVDCDIVKASSGNEALRLLLKRDFAVMLLDVQMPGMDGFEVAMYARANPATRDVPIIFLTALHETEEAMLRGYGSGAVDFLFKPIDPYILRSKVRVFLELYTARSRLADEVDAHRRTTAELEAFAVLIGALETRPMIEKLARLVVPRLTDWCTVAMADAEESASAFAVAPSQEEIVRELEALHPPGRQCHWGMEQVLATGEPQIHRVVTDEILRANSCDDTEYHLLSRLGIASVLVVPLPARGRTLGVISFVSCDPARRYDTPDLALALELGRRVGLAVDNVLLHGEAREAIIARDEFLALASHELRTPVTALQLQHQVLLGMVPPELKEKVRATVRQTARLEQLMENLLDVSRILTDHVSVDVSEVNLGELVEDVVGEMEASASRSGSPIQAHIESDVVGMWDRLRLGQIITNLLTNAIKFGQGKPITVTVKSHGAVATVAVQDQGIGIATAEVERIFDKFERAVAATHFAGLGLGLYIVRRSVETLGGTIRVESRPGEGSTFVVTLPLEQSLPSSVHSLQSPGSGN